MVQVEYIRFLYYQQHKSIRAIARELHCSRKTVRKVLNLEDIRDYHYHLEKPKPCPVTGPYLEIIRTWLEEDKTRPKKQRHTARRIYERLRDEYGFTGSERSIRRAVRKLRKADTQPEVYIPLEFSLGEAAQCDWGEAQVYIGDKLTTVYLFCMRLCASRVSFVRAYLHQKQEAFLEGHRLAFEFFGGVPRKVIHDNLKQAVKKILTGTKREEQEAFLALKAHYVFQAEFCNPGEGHEKGQVESLLGYSRRNFLVPIPQVASIEELNQYLLAKCQEYAGEHLVPGTQRRIAEVWEEEKERLLPLPPKPFGCYRQAFARVDRYSRVRFENNYYSVPSRYVGEILTVRAYVDYIEVWAGKEVVSRHNRLYGNGLQSLDPRHYLDELLRKPRAIPNAKPLKDGTCPEAYEALLSELAPLGREGLIEFKKILQLESLFDREVLTKAIRMAIAQGLPKTLAGIREVAATLAKGSSSYTKTILKQESPVNLTQPVGLKHFDALVIGR